MFRALAAIALATGLAAPAPAPADEGGGARYMYNLADFTGDVSASETPLFYDAEHRELYAASRDSIRVFGKSGMEEFRFPVAVAFGTPGAIVALPGGDILTAGAGYGGVVGRYDHRGEPIGPLSITGAPPELLKGFRADALAWSGGVLYLADRSSFRVICTDEKGAFLRTIDLREKMGFAQKKGRNDDMGGFTVDARGNILFTAPSLFQAFILAPDGTLRAFGTRGSAEGKFNIAGDIAADEAGRVLVLDQLRAVVIVFDPELKFVAEFAGRGFAPGFLIAPAHLAVGDGTVFVSQSANRGVSVFRYAQGTAAYRIQVSQSKRAEPEGS